MFCPLCKTEYREGFDICAECSVPLVAELPQKENQAEFPQLDNGEFVEVFETSDETEILIIKSVLDEEGIPYHFSGEFFRMSGILVTPARLFVPSDLKNRILGILRELQFDA
jgi:hypothetical protein